MSNRTSYIRALGILQDQLEATETNRDKLLRFFPDFGFIDNQIGSAREIVSDLQRHIIHLLHEEVNHCYICEKEKKK